MAGSRRLPISVPHTDVHRLSRRFLEPAQDVIVLGLGLALFGVMVRTLLGMIQDVLAPAVNFRIVIAEVLFMLVMVELVRLLLVYLEQHRVAVDFMVEVSIVATLREIVLHGVVEIPWPQLTVLSIFLLALGVLLRFGDLRESLPAVFGGSSTPAGDTIGSGPESDRPLEARGVDSATSQR